MPNQLINETSPYLLQHAGNPVDWMPWGKAALEKALLEDKPIFLSIGYAACHWCHVMAHESFEDRSIAELLNQNFVSIKVDREERPDLDAIYMDAVVAMLGSGGWPMSVFLTPEGKPFYGGTYFPPFPRHNLPAFRDVLSAAARAWRDDRDEIRRSGQQLTEHLLSATGWSAPSGKTVRANLIQQASQTLVSSYDWQRGGWGRSPLFPQPMTVEFLLLQSARGTQPELEIARHNLLAMSRGGMYDVIGGGFHRYSTDDQWLIPHFEKMLYDNAQLSQAYLHAHLLTGEPVFRQVCEETLDFILRELAASEGGFFSSLDADSDGEEGKFYVWSIEELTQILKPLGDIELFQKVYILEDHGNFENKIVLRARADLSELASVLKMTPISLQERLRRGRLALLNVRDVRIRPATDDKVLLSWNALTLRALAEAGRYLKRDDYLDAARRNADFLLAHLRPEGQLMRSWRKGMAHQEAFLEDYAALILGLLALYQSDPNPRWYQEARQLASTLIERFGDPEGGFFDTQPGMEGLYLRPKENQDNATPSGNSLAAFALLQLAEYDHQPAWRERAEAAIAALQDGFARHPAAFGMWLQAADFLTGPVQQVAIIHPAGKDPGQGLADTLWNSYRPRLIAAQASLPLPENGPALLENRPTLDGRATAYVCQGFTCLLPVTSAEALENQLK